MSTIFIKANPKVAEFLGLTKERYQFVDGDYLLWWRDIKQIDNDWLAHKQQTMEQIGGVVLTDREAAAAQRGEREVILPVATDPRFYIEPKPVDPEEGEGGEIPGIEEERPDDSDPGIEPTEGETTDPEETTEESTEDTPEADAGSTEADETAQGEVLPDPEAETEEGGDA